MNKGTLVLLVLVAVVFAAMWLLKTPTTSSAAARALVADGAKLIDVRTPEEFAAGHVEGAANIPVDQLGTRLKEVGPSTTPVVVYCRSGVRSARATRTLRGAGFEAVHDLGAMSNW